MDDDSSVSCCVLYKSWLFTSISFFVTFWGFF